jgi:anti-sigma regulatory factor (Ser/Thr protein kinase)
MASAAIQANPRLIALTVPSIPGSVPVARLHVQAALGSRGLGEDADDAEIITSELVTNAVQHLGDNGTQTIEVTITYAESPAAVTIAVSDSSPRGPIRRDTTAGSEQGRGLQIIEALSVHWGWRQEGGGKVIFAVLTREA